MKIVGSEHLEAQNTVKIIGPELPEAPEPWKSYVLSVWRPKNNENHIPWASRGSRNLKIIGSDRSGAQKAFKIICFESLGRQKQENRSF